MSYTIVFLIVLAVLFLAAAIKILNEYERGVIFRLGRVMSRAKGPGLIILIPVVDRMVKISLRLVAMDVPPQDVITRDNVSVKVNAVIYFRVMDSIKAVVEVENYLYATSQLAQTTLRSVCGGAELDELLTSVHLGVLGLQTLIDNLLESASIEAGHFRVYARPSHLDEILAEAIRTLLADPDRRQAMGAAARARARQDFTTAAMAERIAAIYREVSA